MTLAQVLPVIFIAVIIDEALTHQATLQRWENDERARSFAGRAIVTDVLTFLVGETLLLYALASGVETTFLVVAPALCSLMLLLGLVLSLALRLGIFPDVVVLDEQARTLKARQLRARAARLSEEADALDGDRTRVDR